MNKSNKTWSKYHGVSNARGTFVVSIKVDKQIVHVAYFRDEMEAAMDYDDFIKRNNLNRRLNFPVPCPESPIPNTKLIRLTRGKFATVDDKNYEWLNQYDWIALKSKTTWYAVRSYISADGVREFIYMHIDIMGKSSLNVDHRNRDGLINMESNLRKCTQRDNTMNREPKVGCFSKYKGVVFDKQSGKIKARIGRKSIGFFKTEEDAAAAYDFHAKKLFGEFAWLNFPDAEREV